MCQGNSSEALHVTPRADFGPKSEVLLSEAYSAFSKFRGLSSKIDIISESRLYC